MSWNRFEDRKIKTAERFMVMIVFSGGRHYSAYLAFNSLVREQVIRNQKYCDVFFDPIMERIGIKFYMTPADHNSYKLFGQKNGTKSMRISACAFLRKWGLLNPFRNGTWRAELHCEAAENMWWFSVAPLLKGAERRAALSPSRPAGKVLTTVSERRPSASVSIQ